jgi:hypothetical protein
MRWFPIPEITITMPHCALDSDQYAHGNSNTFPLSISVCDSYADPIFNPHGHSHPKHYTNAYHHTDPNL